MPTTISNNLEVTAPKPLDSRYAKFVSGATQPYASVAEANSLVLSSRRYKGLVVLINTGSANIEYWYKDGITDGDLVPKETTNIPTPYTTLAVVSNTGTWDMSAVGADRKKVILTGDTTLTITNAVNGTEGTMWATGAGHDLTINGVTYTTSATGKQLLGISHDGTDLNVLWPTEWTLVPPVEPAVLLNDGWSDAGRSPSGNGYYTEAVSGLTTDAQVVITTAGQVTRVEFADDYGAFPGAGSPSSAIHVQFWTNIGTTSTLLGTITGTPTGPTAWETEDMGGGLGVVIRAINAQTPFSVPVGARISLLCVGTVSMANFASLNPVANGRLDLAAPTTPYPNNFDWSTTSGTMLDNNNNNTVAVNTYGIPD